MAKFIPGKKALWKYITICFVFVGFYSILLTFPGHSSPIRINSLHTPKATTRIRNVCQKILARRRSFPSSQQCSNYSTRLCYEGTFNLTALVSYPGSGNTWVRHLIEIASGFFTGSIYFDHLLYARGFMGEKEEWSSGSTIVQKLHTKYDTKQKIKRAILIIRDPVSATRSFVDFMESGIHTGWASPTVFARKEWPMFLLKSIHDWASLAKSWIDAPIDLLVIHYENLVDSTLSELKKILNFLDIDDFRLNTECFQKSMEGSFHRRKPLWKVKASIPAKFQSSIRDAIEYVNEGLLSRGHEPIPLKKYKQSLMNYNNKSDLEGIKQIHDSFVS